MTSAFTPHSGYVRRILDDELDALLSDVSAVSLEGPKGVGKTATAQTRAATIHRLDDPGALETALADPARLLAGREPVLIDEWQLLPVSWDLVRRAVDDQPTPARFLLTGSASPTGAPTHTGAARIVPVRMRPLTLAERGYPPTVSLAAMLSGDHPDVNGDTQIGLDAYVAEILTGGFPGLRGSSPRVIRAQLDGYLERVIDREFREQGITIRQPATLRAWMRAYAAATATTASFEVIRDAATPGVGKKPARSTTGPYRDVLTRLWLLDPVPAWLPTSNRFSELGSSDKHYLADPALAARLLNVSAATLLSGAAEGPSVPRDGTLLGSLFESLVALNLRVYAQAAEAAVRHLRTHRGDHEIDFVLEASGGGFLAIEVKLSATVDAGDARHLLWLKQQLGDALIDSILVTTGSQAYRRRDGIAVVPAALLGP